MLASPGFLCFSLLHPVKEHLPPEKRSEKPSQPTLLSSNKKLLSVASSEHRAGKGAIQDLKPHLQSVPVATDRRGPLSSLV